MVDWFLSQDESVSGYSNVIFSGLPTNELAQIMQGLILNRKQLHGLYHVSANPINKYALLQLIAKTYNKKIKILESKKIKLDRSLNHSKFEKDIGYKPKDWKLLIESMHQFYVSTSENK